MSNTQRVPPQAAKEERAPASKCFLSQISDPSQYVTVISARTAYPELLSLAAAEYKKPIQLFCAIVAAASSTEDVLSAIRKFPEALSRMSLLKIFRRAACPELDNESAKKVQKVKTEDLVRTFGVFFKDIKVLKAQFTSADDHVHSLSPLLAEHDERGSQGYALAASFFDLTKRILPNFVVTGKITGGHDIQLRDVLEGFAEECPCDFIIKDRAGIVSAAGWLRYDSTRGGAQSDDRTDGNANKVDKIKRYCDGVRRTLRVVFVSDGAGVLHKDTWKANVQLDGCWNGNVRVMTLKLVPNRLSESWLLGQDE